MATILRKTDPLCSALADAINDLKAQIGASTKFHLDASEVTVTAADGAGTLAAALTLVNQIRGVWVFHKNDTLAHKVVSTTALTAPAATDLTTAITLANEIKADYNVDNGSTTFHYNADATEITAANATDQASLDTLINEIKSLLNTHMADAPAAASIRLIKA